MSTEKRKDNRILNPRSLPKNIQWMHDFDYVRKLSLKEKLWLDKFAQEYYDGKVKKGDRKALHKTRSLRQDCYTRKNAQNRDLQSIMDCKGKMDRVAAIESPHGTEIGNRGTNHTKKFSEEQ